MNLASERETVATRLVAALRGHGRRDDDELAKTLLINRQRVNQVARMLERQGVLKRAVGPAGKLINSLVDGAEVEQPVAAPQDSRGSSLVTEDFVKRAVYDHLVQQGCVGEVRWGHALGIDIDVTGPAGRFVIEAKGEAGSEQQQRNYFLGALGELVQRMSDDAAHYGLALPDNRQYRGLVSRLPSLVWERLGLVVYFVAPEGEVTVVDPHNREHHS